MEEEDDDLYSGAHNGVKDEPDSKGAIKQEDERPAGGDDDGSEDEESDSDIDIITERPPNATASADVKQPSAAKPAAPTPTPTAGVKHERASSAANLDPPAKRPATSTPQPQTQRPTSSAAKTPLESLKSGVEYPEVRLAPVDLDANPPFDSTGKPITGVDIDADLVENLKPWRRPGADQSEFFNFNFDEFTWTQYCLKQQKMRGEVAGLNAEKDAMMSGTMPAMDGSMGMDPEMQQMMQQMLAGQGGDMGQMDFSAMMGGQMGMAGGGGFGGHGQGGMMDQHPQPPTGPAAGNYGGGGGRGRGRGRRW